ncbi:MAG: oxaloacetate-decarboxylating malate dehydrogenase [Vicinamibacterales bacterium]|jgi:malate dehydrogenase (oxaloacetate-decarboxylating)(NADP+)|nr:oxaloacetate-decarboxylating malate dehydrogenase [Vicinamibacterales bacterium]
MGADRADPRRERHLTGIDILHEPTLNKGTAFTEAERPRLGLRGLLPARMFSQSEQVQRILENFRNKTSDLEKYIFLISLQERNERLFYRVVMDHFEEMMPIIYTPTVGLACQRYSHIWRRPRGVFIIAEERGRVAEVLGNWPYGPVRTIVVTDGERILGLGDLGANGMGIPVGKLSLYTVCAGVDPASCLPVTLDVGTRNAGLRADLLYPRLARERLAAEDYDAFVDEFITAATERFPGVLIQFEDFGEANALRLFRRYCEKTCCFNDDIQGTAGVVLAGFRAIGRMRPEREWAAQKILLVGAGEAGIGIARLVTEALTREGLSADEARQRCWFVDSRGLVVSARADLDEYKREFAHGHAPAPDVLSAVRTLRPTVLIGVSGQPQLFTREVIERMSDANERPIVFALSNPTSKAECTAEQAYAWSAGRAAGHRRDVHRRGGGAGRGCRRRGLARGPRLSPARPCTGAVARHRDGGRARGLRTRPGHGARSG